MIVDCGMEMRLRTTVNCHASFPYGVHHKTSSLDDEYRDGAVDSSFYSKGTPFRKEKWIYKSNILSILTNLIATKRATITQK